MPNVSRLAQRAWYAFKHWNAGSSTDPRLSFVVGYQQGWRHCLSRTAEFSGLIEEVRNLAELLQDARVTQDAIESSAESEDFSEDR